MVSELAVFDDVPRYLMSSNAELRRRAVEALRRELERQRVRRPWGSIEPYIVALYHTVFVDGDTEAGRLLLRYLERVLPENRNVLPVEVQEIADIVMHAVRAEIGEIDRSSALNYVRNYRTTSPISELVKWVAIIELSGEYDDHLGEALRSVQRVAEQKFRYLVEGPEFSDVAEHFFADLAPKLPPIYEYFMRRAEELQKERRSDT